MATAGSNLNYRADIDGLRAVAIVAVVAYHAGIPGFGAGYLGVDVFFVISGFLITSLLWFEQNITGRIAFGSFYARRARRLLPSLFVVLLTVTVAGLLLMRPGFELRHLGVEVFSASVFSSNILFWLTGGYFAAPALNLPLLHTWTLAVEEQFYLVWPVLLVVFGRFVPDAKARTRAVVAALVVLALLSWAAAFFRPPRLETMAFYFSPFRGWEFGVGALLAFLPKSIRRPNKAIQLAALVGLLVCLGLNQAFSSAGLVAVATVCATALLIAAGGGDHTGPAGRLLTLRPVIGIGLVSYGWYLWHWPALSFVRIATVSGVEPLRDSLISLGTLGLAILTWLFIERPVRHLKIPMFSSTRRSLSSGVAIVFSGLVMGGLLFGVGSLPLKPGSIPAQVEAARPYHEPPQYNCSKQRTEPQSCTFGPTQAKDIIILTGDSHAAMIGGGLVDLANRTGGFKLMVRTLTGCRPVQGSSLVQDRCSLQNREVAAQAPELARNGLAGIILGGWWGSARPEEMEQLKLQVRALRSAGVRVALVAESPVFAHDPRNCLLHQARSYCGITRAAFEAQRAPIMLELNKFAATDPGVRIFDLSATYCDEDMCAPLRDGTLYFYDTHHLTAAGSKALYPVLKDMTGWLLGEQPN